MTKAPSTIRSIASSIKAIHAKYFSIQVKQHQKWLQKKVQRLFLELSEESENEKTFGLQASSRSNSLENDDISAHSESNEIYLATYKQEIKTKCHLENVHRITYLFCIVFYCILFSIYLSDLEKSDGVTI